MLSPVSKSKVISLFLFLLSSAAWGVQNKTYPTAATTQIRWDTYTDALMTFISSAPVIVDSTWTQIGNDKVWLNPSTATIEGFTYKLENSSWTVKPTTWTVLDFIKVIQRDTQQKMIFKMVDDDMEEYMVWPDTTTFPKPGEWKGWCLSIVNGNNVPIACPN